METRVATTISSGNGFKGSAALAAVVDILAIPRSFPLASDLPLIKVLETLELDHGNMRLYNPATGELDLVAHKGFPAEYVKKYRTIKLGERSSGRIIRSKGPVLWDNIQTDPGLSYLFLKKKGINSMLGVPVMAREGIIGTLTVASMRRRRFREQEIQLLTAMGRVIGIAVENHRLFATLRNNLDDLTKLTLKLEESDEIKERLLSVMSHELRTPISIILGNVELIMNGFFGDISEKQKDSLLKVRRNGLGLLFHVENALDVSQLEAGEVTIHPDPFTMDHVRETLRELLDDEIQHKRLEVQWEVDERLPPFFTDRERIIKVFRNLIDNAVKFTDKGRVEVRVRYCGEKQTVYCEVEDTGIGIPSSQFQVIFDPFHQIDSSHTRLYGGMGLGLRNVRRTLELLGGGIEVESHVGKGTLFKFSFPIHAGVASIDGK